MYNCRCSLRRVYVRCFVNWSYSSLCSNQIPKTIKKYWENLVYWLPWLSPNPFLSKNWAKPEKTHRSTGSGLKLASMPLVETVWAVRVSMILHQWSFVTRQNPIDWNYIGVQYQMMCIILAVRSHGGVWCQYVLRNLCPILAKIWTLPMSTEGQH